MSNTPARQWFRYDDGTFYRNCPLIDRELEALRRSPKTYLNPRLLAALRDLEAEWRQTFSRGVQYKAELGPGDECAGGIAPVRQWWPALTARLTADFGSDDASEYLDHIDSLPNLPGDPRYRWLWMPGQGVAA